MLVPVVVGGIVFFLFAGRFYVGTSQIMLMFLIVVFLFVFLLLILERKIRMILRSGDLFYD